MTGILDTRSEPSDVALGAWRYKSNFQLSSENKLCCRPGHQKLFSSYLSPLTTPPSYTNFDHHDQGDFTLPNPVREATTLLFEAQDNTGKHWLYEAGQSRIKVLDEVNGVWTTVARGMGGPTQAGVAQTRFRAAELQQVVMFTNGVDRPLVSNVGSGATSQVADLNTLGVTTGLVVVEFNGCLFLMNLTEAGQQISSRVRWSDLNNPLTWITGPNSIADFQDLDYGEAILAAAPMAGSLYIFTTRGIWRAFVSGSTKAFGFVKVYSEPLNQAKCIFFPNTLVSNGNEVWYGAIDGIYRFDPYIPEPERTEWLYRGMTTMFNDETYAGDPNFCQSVVAGIHPIEKEIYISWPELNGTIPGAPTKTIVWDYKYKSVDVMDFGFSCFGNYRPNPLPNQACASAQLFIGAACNDFSLKEVGVTFSRERLVNTTGQGTVKNGVYTPFIGVYAFDGYYRILRALLPYQNYDRDKLIRKLLLEVSPVAQPVPCVVRMRLGNSFSETDPNLPDGLCAVLWRQMKDMPLKCLDTMTASQYIAKNLHRDSGMEWPMLEKGRFLYVEFTIANADGSPAIGGQSCFSRIETEVAMLPKL